MGLDILIYNNDGICMNKSEISEDLHYWLFNLANLDKGRFRTIFRVQDYYKTNIQLSKYKTVWNQQKQPKNSRVCIKLSVTLLKVH